MKYTSMKKSLYIVGGVVLVLLALGYAIYYFFLRSGSVLFTNTTNNPTIIVPTPTTRATPNTSFTFPFSQYTLKIARSAGTYAQSSIIDLTVTSIKNVPVSSLFMRNDWDTAAFFDTQKQLVYELQPGGYIQWSIVNNSYITAQTSATKTTTDKTSGVTTTRKCTVTTGTLGSITNTKQVTCTFSTYSIPHPTEMVNQNVITSCYLPIPQTSDYLAVEMPQSPASSTIDVCTILKNTGINSIQKL